MPKPRYTPDEYRQRPREFDPRIADLIVEMVTNGEDLKTICEFDRDMPLPGTFIQWTRQDSALGLAYDEAKRIRAEVYFEEIVPLSDAGDSNRARIQVDARKYHTQQAAPDKYGRGLGLPAPPRTEDAAPDYASEVRRKLDDMVRRLETRRAA